MVQKRMIRLDEDSRPKKEEADLREEDQVKLHKSDDYIIPSFQGTNYQKCGGGRRVIRKGRGN